jgi:hypothetical protein
MAICQQVCCLLKWPITAPNWLHTSTYTTHAMSENGAGIMCNLHLETQHPLTHPPATMMRAMSVTPAGTVKLEVPTCKGCQ